MRCRAMHVLAKPLFFACFRCYAEVQPFFDSAAWLEDFDQLNALHWDEASGEYRDWGSHTGGS
jgi:hypothetical protein